jgi:protein SCO1/2
MQRKRVAEATKGAGKPLVGGPFELLDQHGNKFTHEDLKGRYSLVRKIYDTRDPEQPGC